MYNVLTSITVPSNGIAELNFLAANDVYKIFC